MFKLGILFTIILFSLASFAEIKSVEVITRDSDGNFVVPLFPNQSACNAKRDGFLNQHLIIRSNPFQVEVVDSEKQYIVFDGSHVSQTAECHGATTVVENSPQLNLKCTQKLDPAGRRTLEKTVFIEFRGNNGTARISTVSPSSSISTTWSLSECNF